MTLLEVLVVLAVIAVMTTLALGMRHSPSASLRLEQEVAALQLKVARARRDAILLARPQELVSEGCGEVEAHLMFFPNGTATGDDICIVVADRRLQLSIDPIVGHLQRVDQ